jgi:hypothetical protein
MSFVELILVFDFWEIITGEGWGSHYNFWSFTDWVMKDEYDNVGDPGTHTHNDFLNL